MEEAVNKEVDDLIEIDRSMYRLIMGGFLRSVSPHIVINEDNRYTQRVMYHPHYSHPPLGRLLEGQSEYLSDICEVMFSDQSHMTHQEFLTSFRDRMKDDDKALEFRLVQDGMSSGNESQKNLPKYIENILLAWQIPYIDFCVLLGTYTLHRANEENIVQLSQRVEDSFPCVVYQRES